MLGNYLLTAYRNIARNRLHALLSIGGLAVGFAACIAILLFVRYEFSYDTWLENHEDIFRIETTYHDPGQPSESFASSPGPIKAALLKDYGDIIDEVVGLFAEPRIVGVGARQFEETITAVDRNFFEVFNLEAIVGDPRTALQEVNSIVLTESMAAKYFGQSNPLSQILTLDNKEDYQVTAIIRDLPDNTHLEFDFLVPLVAGQYEDRAYITESWFSAPQYVYLKLRSEESAEAIRADLTTFTVRNVPMTIEGLESVAITDFMGFDLAALADIHLFSRKLDDISPPGNIATVTSFAIAAIFILVVAVVNYVNLATARAIIRAREVGLRKVLGAKRLDLVLQFVGESLIFSAAAFVVAAAFVELMIPSINVLLNVSMPTGSLFTSLDLILSLAMLAVVGIAGGLYPAVYLSSFRPSQVLRGRKASMAGSDTLRNSLIVVQFAVAIALIVGTVIIFAQTRYALSKDLGFEDENQLVLSGIGEQEVLRVLPSLRNELEKLPGVIETAVSWDVPSQGPDSNIAISLPSTQASRSLFVRQSFVGFNFFGTYGIEASAGRLFSADREADLQSEYAEDGSYSAAIVVNETARALFGFASGNDAVNQTVFTPSTGQMGGRGALTIIGVVDDFHIDSVREAIKPMIYFVTRENLNFLTVRIHEGPSDAVARNIDRIWGELLPQTPIKRTYIDENFAGFYADENRQVRLFLVFSVLAVSLAAMGMYGLASFSVERKTLEIGVRKVLGAGEKSLLWLLSWQFLKPVLVASIVAWPIAWYFLDMWLQAFVYRIELNLIPFLFASVMAVFFALAAVSSHTLRVVRSNPIQALKSD